jgi:hypothetical protein
MIPLVGDQTGAFLALKCIRFESRTPTWAKTILLRKWYTSRKLYNLIMAKKNSCFPYLSGTVNVTGCNLYAFTYLPFCWAGIHRGPFSIASTAILASLEFFIVVAFTSLT